VCHVVIIIASGPLDVVDSANRRGTTDYSLQIIRTINDGLSTASISNLKQREAVSENVTSVQTRRGFSLINAVANCCQASVT
jgi:hypothetical protein